MENDREITGGYTTIKGERRFIPLSTRKKPNRTPHCKSCAYFRRPNKCVADPNTITFTSPEAEACENYVNRTWRNTR